MMFLRKKAQSTAEYAITIGIVVAVVAGVMSVALKGGMRQKATQATDLLKNAGTGLSTTASADTDITGAMGITGTGGVLQAANDSNLAVYEGDARHTTVNQQDSESILKKGGAMISSSNSASQTNTFNYESYNAVHGGSSN
jgi:hypothetical protein